MRYTIYVISPFSLFQHSASTEKHQQLFKGCLNKNTLKILVPVGERLYLKLLNT